MSLAGVRVMKDEQITLTGKNMLKLPSPEHVNNLEMIKMMMPEVSDGLHIRPSMDTEDVKMVMDGLIERMARRGETSPGCAEVRFMRRILSHVRGRSSIGRTHGSHP
jgi:hypothetical protein